MALTFSEIKRLVAPYAGRAGKCASSEEVSRFARDVMSYLLLSGSAAGTRKLCIWAYKGCISLPPEVELPLKARIDKRQANIWDKWFTFHSVSDDLEACPPAGEIIAEDGVMSPLAYMLPEAGSIIGVMGTCEEPEGPHISVQGKDTTGRPIYTYFRGKQVYGEEFQISKNQVRYGKVTFGEITAVVKPKTNGYVALFAVNPRTEEKVFLADYSPSDEKPMYRRFRIISRSCPSVVHVTMLCRVRLKDNYLDNEITFFENSVAVKLAAQRLQAEDNNDANTANYKRQATEDLLEKEAGYKKISGGPVSTFFPLSGGAIKNIVG